MTLLTEQALDGWLARWRAQDMPYVDAWQPGLSADEIAAHGVALPPELKTWWGWRNGTTNIEHDGRSGSVWMTPIFIAWPLEVALAQTAAFLDDVAHSAQASGHTLESWLLDERWIMLGGGVVRLFACLDPAPNGRSEVRAVDFEDIFEPRPGVPSLGTLVGWWTEAIDAGLYRWDAERRRWDAGAALPPVEWRATGLV